LSNLKLPSAAILMATFNGEKFLVEQLESIAAQTFKNWRIYVSDDGSSDGTLAILTRYQELWGSDKLIIINGPQKGFAQNFLSLACDKNIKADFYAFSDQDDLWMPEKLKVAIEHILTFSNKEQAYGYGGRTTYVDEKLKFIGYSPLFVFPRTFRNALIQSIAGGNTIVFNQKVKFLLEKTGALPVIAHDWWLYQLITASGGIFFYDSKSFIYYRQHIDSVIGSNQSFKDILNRLGYIINGQYKQVINQNVECLLRCSFVFTSDSVEILHMFNKMRQAKFKDRLRLFEVCGLYRQTWRGTISLRLFSILNRL
jgi:glycosyltransferase involved in cell wall biosynthesis